MDWQTFLAMGGYAVYVWPAYALALVLLAGNWIAPELRERRLLRSIARRAAARRGP